MSTSPNLKKSPSIRNLKIGQAVQWYHEVRHVRFGIREQAGRVFRGDRCDNADAKVEQ